MIPVNRVKATLAYLFLLFLLVFSSPSLLFSETALFSDLRDALIGQTTGADTIKLVLISPDPESGDIDPGFAAWLKEQLTIALSSRSSSISVLVRDQSDLIGQEQQLQEGSLYDPQWRADFGKKVGANAFGFINLVDWGYNYVIYLDLIQAGTGALLASGRQVVMKETLPARFLPRSRRQLREGSSPNDFFYLIKELANSETLSAFSSRSLALSSLKADGLGDGIRQAFLLDLRHLLTGNLPVDSVVIARSEGSELLYALREEMEQIENPDEMEELAPRLRGADVLINGVLELDQKNGMLSASLTYIDAEKGTYLPGSASRSIPLNALYRKLYLGETYLRVETTPPGLPFLLDGTPAGTSPADLLGVPPGEHTVEVKGIAPYAGKQELVQVDDRGVTLVSIALEKPDVELRILDAGTKAPLQGFQIDTQHRYTLENGAVLFSDLSTAADASLELTISREGYITTKAVIPLHPDMNLLEKREILLKKQEKRLLSIRSEPAGAMVFLDNRHQGKTPWDTEIEMKQDRIKLRLFLPGWNRLEEEILLVDLAREDVISRTLTRDVWIASTPPGAFIKVNGEDVGRSDLQLPLSAGNNTIEFKLQDREQQIAFDPAKTGEDRIHVVLQGQEKLVPMILESNVPGLEVWGGDRKAEMRGNRVLLPQGYQRIRFAKPGFAPYVRYLQVQEGESLKVFLLTVEEQEQLDEATGLLQEGKEIRALELVEQLLKKNPDSPQIRLAALEGYLVGMVRLNNRLFTNKNDLNRLARSFDDLYRSSRFHDPQREAGALYLRARYEDLLSRVYEETGEYLVKALAIWSDYIALFQNSSKHILGDQESRDRYDYAWYRRALLSVERFSRSGSQRDREAAIGALQDYIGLAMADRPEDSVEEARTMLGELRSP